MISCNKALENNNNVKVITDFPLIETVADIEEPEAGESVASRVYESAESAGTHTIKWKKGDEFSMFGVVTATGTSTGTATTPAQGDILNYSHLRQTLIYGDGTKTFSMTYPDMKTMYGTGSGVQTNVFAIHPATTLNVTLNGAYSNYKATPASTLSIPAVQDGTGWPYSIWFSRNSQLTAATNNANAGGFAFFLASTILRVKISSSKNITRVVLTTTGAVLVGNVTELTLNYMSGTDTANFTISGGCLTNSVTLENGGILPDDLYISVRDLREGSTNTFVFTAEDGSTCTKVFSNPAGYANRRMRGVFYLGTVTIGDSDWVPAS